MKRNNITLAARLKRWFSLAFIIGMPLFNTVMAQDKLEDYLMIAAEQNPGLKAAFNQYMAALEKVPQVRALPDPQVAFGYFIQPVETRNGPMNFKISANQMFPWFGTLKARGDAATAEARVQYEYFEDQKSKLYQEIKLNWYNLYFNGKASVVTRDNIRLLQTFRHMANAKVEAGKVSAVDQYRLEMEINDLENQLARLNDMQVLLEIQFKNLISSEENIRIHTPDSLIIRDITPDKESLRDSVKIQNHRLTGLDLKMSALQQKQVAARRSGGPNISLGFDYTVVGKGGNNMSGNDAFMFPMVGISIPLYRHKYKSMVQEVSYQETATGFEIREKSNTLENLFEKSWNELQDANRRIDLFNRQYNLASRSLQLIETQYANSSINFEEVLRMERRLLNYRLELEKARTDKMASIAFIEYLMGK